MSSRDLSSQAALPAMFGLLDQVSWPSDFGVFELGSVLIRESTHPFSPLSVHRSMVGRRRSLVRARSDAPSSRPRRPSCAGRCWRRRRRSSRKTHRWRGIAGYIDDIIAQTRGDGYASSVGGSEAGISAIALPIQGGGPVLGSLNLIFFSSSMTPEVAAKRYLPDMKQAVKEIERRWSAANAARGKVA